MKALRVFIWCCTVSLIASCTKSGPATDQDPGAPISNVAEATPVAAATPSGNLSVNSNALPREPTAMDYVREGTVAYVAHDFVRAIPFYQRALELEKKDRKLDKKIWLVLVDNLAMAHGMAGDIKNSLSVLEYGISKDPTYPMFYYNMACGYGETGDEDNAIKYLRLATKYKANMIPGESFPDPANDNSFRKFSESDKFKKALAELNHR